VLLTPVLIYVLDLSLAGPEGFARAQRLLSGELSASMWFVLAWALLHHLLAGIRYLALDLDVGVDKATERTTAWLVLVGAPLAALLLMAGVWL
jgi:succinate dehydrogenase / fumarate reductase cytochrome b subunit